MLKQMKEAYEHEKNASARVGQRIAIYAPMYDSSTRAAGFRHESSKVA
jgi:hypothetical protein